MPKHLTQLRLNGVPWFILAIGYFLGAGSLCPSLAQTIQYPESAPGSVEPSAVGSAQSQAPNGPANINTAGFKVAGEATVAPAGFETILQTGCASGTCSSGGCGSGGCSPGYTPCDAANYPESHFGRALLGISRALCCPDPCYEGKWNILADASFYGAGPRPITQVQILTEFGWGVPFPDKAEIFWAQDNGMGKGPKPAPGVLAETNARYQQGAIYTEGAIDRFGVFVVLPYRNVSGDTTPSASNFGDMMIGTKSLLIDSELLLASLQFITTIPTGNFSNGTGTGHVSLQPGLLFALNLASKTYLQGELAYQFALGGDQNYAGSYFHYNASLNHMLCELGQEIQLVGVMELDGYQICSGSYTAPWTGLTMPAKDLGTILSVVPGLRVNFCNKADIGISSSFAVTDDALARTILKAQLRFRF